MSFRKPFHYNLQRAYGPSLREGLIFRVTPLVDIFRLSIMRERVPLLHIIRLSKLVMLWNGNEKAASSLGIKYPTLRDHFLHTGGVWLEGRRQDDATDGLWRIHDGLYDLRQFGRIHPGGPSWIKSTKGTDITEAFESHHISTVPETLLPKYFVRKAANKRNFPFTFEENGFYRTLKRNIREELQKDDHQDAIERSKYLTDMLLFFYVILSLAAANYQSFTLGALAGIALSHLAIAAHNFFHKRDNFRMYYFDLTLMTWREWRITHALSHHMYTNTICDIEISSAEPFLQYLPIEKHFFVRYFSQFYSPILYIFTFFFFFIRTFMQIFRYWNYHYDFLLPLIIPLSMIIVTNQSFWFCGMMFIWIGMVGGVHFGIVGVNAAHHHPDIFHDGDTPRPAEQLDWGVHQLDAVMDRKDINGSHFLVLTNFGDHALHHLFPTLDHGVLKYLHPVFLDTCQQFGVEWRLSTQFELVKGQFRQLARVEGKNVPPGFRPSSNK